MVRSKSKSNKMHDLRIIVGITVLILLVAGNATATTLTVCSSGCNYSSIQTAVDAAHPADTIIVMDGTYIENIDINLPHLTIRSENGSASTYIIASGSNNNVFEITADFVNISGFTIKGANGDCYSGTGVGVQLNKSNNSTISNNSLLSNDCGINLVSSMHNIISYNNVAKNDWVGIRLYSSKDNLLSNNNVIFNYGNILLDESSSNNIIANNNVSISTDGDGINIFHGSNFNRVTNNTFNSNYGDGISLLDTSYNIIENSNVTSNDGSGISIRADNNVIANNTVESNRYYGIEIYWSSNNFIVNNSVNSNNIGIELMDAPRNTLTGNKMSSNRLENIDISALYGIDGYIQFFDTSNMEEGRPIYYVVNAVNTEYNSSTNAAFFVCVLCNNITVKDLYITSKSESLHFIKTDNSKIQNITFDEKYLLAIHIETSDNNIIENNTIYNRNYGILMDASFGSFSDNNTISRNILINDSVGIDFTWSDYNTIANNIISLNKGSAIGLYNSFCNNITQNILLANSKAIVINGQSDENIVTDNNISLNEIGIKLLDSYRNIISHNNIRKNKIQANDNKPAKNFWNHPELLEGNYWSDYSGSDDGSGTGKHDFSGDHIGDTLIPHPSAGYDFYPYIYENGWMRPTIIVYTDKTNYMAGDTMKVGLNITNPGSVTTLALDIWVDLPDGGKKVVISNPSITLPDGLNWKKYPWMSITLPNIPLGNYIWHATLKNSTAGNIISESISPWTFSIAATGSQEEMEKMLQNISEEIVFVN